MLRKGNLLSKEVFGPDAQKTAFALGYPPFGSMTAPQKTAFALGYPPPSSMTAPQKTAFALGYPPPSSMTAPQKTAFALGQPASPNNNPAGSNNNPAGSNNNPAGSNNHPPAPPLPVFAAGYPPGTLSTGHLCQGDQFSDEPEIFVGTDPAPGQVAKSGGKIRVWVNDEDAPKIALNEKVNPTTGQITPGDRTATDKGSDKEGARQNFDFLWEPALYITSVTLANQSGPFSGDAENGGKPYFPSLIKGDYNPNPNSTKQDSARLSLQGPPIDPDHTQFENGPGSGFGVGLFEQFTAEYIWDVNALGLPPGPYHVEIVIHDGDIDLGIDCIALKINGAPASSQQPVPTASNKSPAVKPTASNKSPAVKPTAVKPR